MDTLKSLAVITLLGAVLYGVYVVVSKPDRPPSPEMASLADGADAPLIEDGRQDSAPPITPPSRRESRPAPSFSKPKGVARIVAETPVEPAPRSVSEVEPAVVEEEPSDRHPFEQTTYEPREHADDYPVPSPREKQQRPEKPNSVKVRSGHSSADDAEIEAAQRRIRLYGFQTAWKTAQEQVTQGRHREALLALTPFYDDPAIPADQQEELVGWLDALAAKVVYSTEHLLEPAHIVRRGETLYSISNSCHVPYLLLKNINAVRDNDVLLPGSQLKIVRGPFQAEVDLSRQEITVYVQKLYAGRFNFTLGPEPAPPGEYLVKVKEPAKQFSSPQGVLGPKDPRNPYGGIYIDLGKGVSIHGSPGEAYNDQPVGCIQLAPRDAEDLFAILAKDESVVVIKQ
jgi:LysM repeat protein